MSGTAPGTAGPTRWSRPTTSGEALDEIGEDVLAGMSPRSRAAPADAQRGATAGRAWTRCASRPATGPASCATPAGWTAPWTRSAQLLDQALDSERSALFPDPSDSARLAEAELDALPVGHRPGGPGAGRLPVALARGGRDVPADLGPAALGGARRPVRRPARRAGQPRPAGDGSRSGEMLDDLNEMLDADARGEHTAGRLRRVHGQARPVLPRQPGRPRRAGRLAGPPGGRRRAADELAHPEQRAELGCADGAGDEPGRPGRADGPAAGSRCARPVRTCRGAARSGCTGDAADGLCRRHRGAGRTGRPGRAGRTRRCRTIPAPAWPTSTRSWSSGRWAGRRSRTWSSCAGSSASCSGRAIWNRAAAAWS